MARKVWFITGISRGLGNALAEAALARGDLVVGTTRDGAPPANLAAEGLRTLALDVVERDRIAPAVRAAQACHGRLDVVVNNAGYGLLGPVEASTPEQAAHVFAVNFFGPLDVIRAVLPFLRAQGGGHIVNLSSIAGLAPMGGSALYAAAKFALEGMSQSLAQEVAPFGIRVTIVEPGAFRTDFLSPQSIRQTGALDDYAATSGQTLNTMLAMDGKQIGDPAKGAAAIIRAVDAEEPPLNLVLGSDALRRTKARLERFQDELARWQDVTLGTDYPG